MADKRAETQGCRCFQQRSRVPGRRCISSSGDSHADEMLAVFSKRIRVKDEGMVERQKRVQVDVGGIQGLILAVAVHPPGVDDASLVEERNVEFSLANLPHNLGLAIKDGLQAVGKAVMVW